MLTFLASLVSVGLLIWVIVKQSKCCKKECSKEGMQIAKNTPPSCQKCNTSFTDKQKQECHDCYQWWNDNYSDEADGTFYCPDGGSGISGLPGCYNKYEQMNASACLGNEAIAISSGQCDAPILCSTGSQGSKACL